MSPELKYEIARVLNYVMFAEERSFEDIQREHGEASDEARDHIYNVARNLWVELDLDHNRRHKLGPLFPAFDWDAVN